MQKTFNDKMLEFPKRTSVSIYDKDGNCVSSGGGATGWPLLVALESHLRRFDYIPKDHPLTLSEADDFAYIRKWGRGSLMSNDEEIEIVLKK